MYTGPILDTGSMGAFFGGTLFRKKAISLLAPPRQMFFSTIYSEYIFFKTRGKKLGAIIALNKFLA